jgi:LemA protein
LAPLSHRKNKAGGDSQVTTLLIILGIAAAVILYGVLLYNNLVSLRNRVKNGFSQIDVQLTRRHDLIPNLVEAVKG